MLIFDLTTQSGSKLKHRKILSQTEFTKLRYYGQIPFTDNDNHSELFSKMNCHLWQEDSDFKNAAPSKLWTEISQSTS